MYGSWSLIYNFQTSIYWHATASHHNSVFVRTPTLVMVASSMKVLFRLVHIADSTSICTRGKPRRRFVVLWGNIDVDSSTTICKVIPEMLWGEIWQHFNQRNPYRHYISFSSPLIKSPLFNVGRHSLKLKHAENIFFQSTFFSLNRAKLNSRHLMRTGEHSLGGVLPT